MKKIFTLVFIAIGFLANAQSLRLIKEDGSYVTNNETIEVNLPNGENETDTYFGYENLTSQGFGFYVKKEVLSFEGNDNSMILFCIGNCYEGDLSALITVGANQVVTATDPMAFHSSFQGRPAKATVKYTFYAADNESDCVSFTINYKDGSGIRQADMVKSLQASPNPATNFVTVSFAAPSADSYIVIKNLTGKEVYREQVNGNSGRQSINLNGFSAGMYLYGIESDGKMLCTKKLLIK